MTTQEVVLTEDNFRKGLELDAADIVGTLRDSGLDRCVNLTCVNAEYAKRMEVNAEYAKRMEVILESWSRKT